VKKRTGKRDVKGGRKDGRQDEGDGHTQVEGKGPVFREVALPALSDREKSQLYVQRYIQHFPAAGEIVIFDRSWHNAYDDVAPMRKRSWIPEVH
jgi:polyphosphate kinase